MSNKVESLYPLDKNRKLLSERQDPNGSTYKIFRLFANDGDSIDIEAEIKHPKAYIRPLDENRKIIAQEKSSDGYLNKIMMTKEGAEIKEYWIEEKIPSKRSNGGIDEESNKKQKTFGIEKMIQDFARKKKYPPSDDFLLLLAKTKVEELNSTENRPIITVDQNESISSAFKKLLDHQILSVPVVLQDNSYYGFLDILDIVSWVVNLLGEESISKEDIEKMDTFCHSKVARVMVYPISKKNPFHPFPVGNSLLSAFEQLALGTHRVPVVNDHGQLVNIITQSSAIRFVEQNIHLLGEKKNMPLESMYLADQYVMSINSRDSAIDAFRLMKITKVSAVAIVNDDGKLVGNCSAKDLKKIPNTTEFIRSLFLPLNEYLKDQQEITFATKDETLGVVIRRIVENKLHRIYILDDDMKPEGILSLKDIMEEILKTS